MRPRKSDRRSYTRIPDFPFPTRNGVVRKERRRLFDRRTRNMQVGWFRA